MVQNKRLFRKRLTITEGADLSVIDGLKTTITQQENKKLSAQNPGPAQSLSLEIMSITQPGISPYIKNKANQDASRYIEFENGKVHIFMVCDGHGKDGELVSKYIVDNYPEYFLDVLLCHKTDVSNLTKKDVVKSIHESMVQFDKKVKKQKFDTFYSGSTVIMCILINKLLYTANVGDSRAILLPKPQESEPDEQLQTFVELSTDLKPDVPKERERIEKFGGRVSKHFSQTISNEMENDDSPYRVWLKDKNIPGLAMSRAIGDFVVKDSGVIANPDITVIPLNQNYINSGTVLLASDGVWEFIENRVAADIVSEFSFDNLQTLVDKSVLKWNEYTYNMVVDDITALMFKYKIDIE